MTLTYQLGDALYLNITNRCSCACVFCIRRGGDGVGDGGSLWLERDPTAAQVIAALGERDLTRYTEAVFCGYGEPTENLEVLLEVCRYLRRAAPGLPVRLNTNGLCDLTHGRAVAPLLHGLVDEVSISLNAPDAARYQQVTRPACGERGFAAMLRFAADCKAQVPSVRFTVVDVLEPEEIRRCAVLAEGMGIPLRVREKI